MTQDAPAPALPTDDDPDEVEPLLVVEGPPVRAPLRSWAFNVALALWIAAGMAQYDLLALAPWPHLSGRAGRFVLVLTWSTLGLALYARWDERRKRRGGTAVLFRDRVYVKKHPEDPGRRVRWSRLRGYTQRGDHVRLRRDDAAPGLAQDLAYLLGGGDLTIPTPTPEEAAAVVRALEACGVRPVED